MYLSTVTTNPALVIEPGGDVGIGTGATANYRLDLSDTIADQNPILYAAASGTPPDAFNWIAEFMAPNIAQDRRVTLALGKARSSNNSVTMSYVQRASTGNNALTFGHFGNNDLVCKRRYSKTSNWKKILYEIYALFTHSVLFYLVKQSSWPYSYFSGRSKSYG